MLGSHRRVPAMLADPVNHNVSYRDRGSVDNMATISPLVTPSSEGNRSLVVTARTPGGLKRAGITLVYLQCCELMSLR